MSHAASAGGMNGGGDKKGKAKMEINLDSPPSSDRETEQEEIDKKTSRRHSAFDSMASLEAALPIKRGLSRNYDGKSKQFGNLTELGFEDAKNMVKREHPINKTPRLLMAHDIYFEKIKSKAIQDSSVPCFHYEDHEHEDDEDDDNKNQEEDGK